MGLRTAGRQTNALAQKENLDVLRLCRAACTLTRRATCCRKSRDDLSRLAAADAPSAAGEVIFDSLNLTEEGPDAGMPSTALAVGVYR